MSTDYTLLIIFALGGLAFACAGIYGLNIFRPQSAGTLKHLPYECGEPPIGHAHTLFSIKYYLIALLFILFEAELLFVLPWAKVMKTIQSEHPDWTWIVFGEISLFIFVLCLGIAYAWAKGKSHLLHLSHAPQDIPTKVPESLYQAVNETYRRASNT